MISKKTRYKIGKCIEWLEKAVAYSILAVVVITLLAGLLDSYYVAITGEALLFPGEPDEKDVAVAKFTAGISTLILSIISYSVVREWATAVDYEEVEE